MNPADIIVVFAVLAVAGIAVMIFRRNRKNGKRCCGCDCTGCSQNCRK